MLRPSDRDVANVRVPSLRGQKESAEKENPGFIEDGKIERGRRVKRSGIDVDVRAFIHA